jgi:hypothetical protein
MSLAPAPRLADAAERRKALVVRLTSHMAHEFAAKMRRGTTAH